MGKKLRPCPWCGTTPMYVEKYVYDNKWTQYRVGCEQHDCDAQPTVDWHYFTEQEAIDAWNNQAVAMEKESLKVENAKLRKLVRDYHTFLALAELAQPIGSVIAAHGHPTLSVKALDKRYRKLGIEVDA